MHADSPIAMAAVPRLLPQKARPELDVIVPAHNERDVIGQNVRELAAHLSELSHEYDWRILIVNDGSNDGTGALAEAISAQCRSIHVIHHIQNQGLGAAIWTGVANGKSDFVVTMDADLSYSPRHIGRMLQAARSRHAHLVLASPYLGNGCVSRVPFFRALLSRAANRYLLLMCGGRVHTFTCMVRVFHRSFLEMIRPVSTGPEINLEILMNAFKLGVTIVEIPAHLCWRHTHRRTPWGSRRMDLMKRVMDVIRWGVRLRAAQSAVPRSACPGHVRLESSGKNGANPYA
jgi:glycosyltransferase involved in cell wall biosynthesis